MSKVPAIRFRGFSGEWANKELGELGSVAMNKRIFKEQTSNEGDVPFFKIGTFGSEPDAFISRKLFDEYKSKYPFPQKGDLLISASGSIGRIVEYSGDDEYFQDSNIVWLKHDDKLENSFLKVFYSIVKWSGLEGSTIKRLYNKNILETPISVPLPKEQTKIGNYFQQLDTLISQHQQKHDKLLNLKKALLEKMFPKQGFDVPEIRFKGFSGEWEERKLGGIVDVTSVKRIHQSDWTVSGIRFLRARDIVSAFKNEKPSDYLYITKEKYTEYSLISGKVKEGDLLVTGVGTIGVPMLITDDEPVYFKDGNIIWFKNENLIDGNFLYSSFINNEIQALVSR
ncbi:MAG: restriction endonuclease subunit S [Xanthomonadales bacterium]|nr:restriction endonuclease subunit S [Xanthomonadales bacterium]